MIVDRAWIKGGVRVWHWPCGTVALSTVNSRMDRMLLQQCIDQLVGTWGKGALAADVMDTLRWVGAQ
jgi:hypothetical protein